MIKYILDGKEIYYEEEANGFKKSGIEELDLYLNDITWVPYDDGKRKETCRDALERLNEYIPVNIGEK